MSAREKTEILTLVADSGLPHHRALAQLRLPRSTYYRWLKRLAEGELEDKKGVSLIPWNKIRPEEETRILTDVYTGRHLEIIKKRKEIKSRTLEERKGYNNSARQLGKGR